jgi:hypothetical protein
MYVEFLQPGRSLDGTIHANQTAIGQPKLGLVNRHKLSLEGAVFIRCPDDKVLGHGKAIKVSLWSFLPWSSSTTFVALMKVLHHCDQLPFGPHSDVVWWEKSIENLESQRSGKFEILHCKANRGGTLSDHANVSRHGKELEKARSCVFDSAKAQRQRIVVQLWKRRGQTTAWEEAGGIHTSYTNIRHHRQAIEIDRDPTKLIRIELQQVAGLRKATLVKEQTYDETI